MTDTRGNQGDLIEVRLSDPTNTSFENAETRGSIVSSKIFLFQNARKRVFYLTQYHGETT